MMDHVAKTEDLDVKQIQDFPGYFACWDGRILSDRRGSLLPLKPIPNKGNGYLRVYLMRDGKKHARYVHRLILETFHGPAEKGMQCRHLDGNLENNNTHNLAWGTYAENAKDRVNHGTTLTGTKNHQTKLTPEKVTSIRKLYSRGIGLVDLANAFGVNRATVWAACTGRTWRGVGGPIVKKGRGGFYNKTTRISSQ